MRNFFEISNPQDAVVMADFAALEGHFKNTNNLVCAETVGVQYPSKTKVFNDRTFNNVSFKHAHFRELSFKGCTFVDCIFLGCHFEDVEFHDTRIKNCNFYKARFTNVYLDLRLVHFDSSFEDTHSNVMLGFYQEMYRNYSEAHQWKFSLFADIARRRWDRHQTKYRIKKWFEDWRSKENPSIRDQISNVRSYCANKLYDLLMAYGYGPGRFFIWTCLFILGFSYLTYRNWEIFGFSEDASPSYPMALFYIATVWSTLGYSSHVPTSPMGLYLSSGLGMAGLGWSGLFVAILVRRFVR